MTAGERLPSALGAAVKELRRQRSWTQADLAGKTGLSVTSVSNIENGVTNRVNRTTRRALADAFGVAEEELDPVALARRVASDAVSLLQRRAVILALDASPDVLHRLLSRGPSALSDVVAVLDELSRTRRTRRKKRTEG
jgi:transcriptional regulator with XRE-family HTH domain